MSFEIRQMSRADLNIALGWARDEGWNPGLDDGDAFYAQDPTGFLMGWLDGEPAGSVSVVKYDGNYAFLGLYIVRPQWRGHGYGKAIWDAGIASAGDRTIGLDGVVAQQENYRKSGFLLAHRSARWGGVIKQDAPTDSRLREVTLDDLPAIIAFDRECFPARRDAFLAAWLAPAPGRRTLCSVQNGRLTGFGTIRPAVQGHKIGPVFAETSEVGTSLVRALAALAGTQPVFIDIPASNGPSTQLAASLGLAPSFETARMYRGPAPQFAQERMFAITTLELG